MINLIDFFNLFKPFLTYFDIFDILFNLLSTFWSDFTKKEQIKSKIGKFNNKYINFNQNDVKSTSSIRFCHLTWIRQNSDEEFVGIQFKITDNTIREALLPKLTFYFDRKGRGSTKALKVLVEMVNISFSLLF